MHDIRKKDEECIVCHKKLSIDKEMDIAEREYYIEGAGQLCMDCYSKIFDNRRTNYEDYFKEQLELYKNDIEYQDKKIYEFFKRLIDIIFSLVVMIPVLCLVGILCIVIRIDSKGNPIFSQVRVGKDGRLIKIHKLRSMVADAEKDGQKWAAENDPRVTRVGKFIRKYRLDELPQFYDVLLGRMSLVGPRPEIPSLSHDFNEEYPGFVTRLLVIPGLSGWAQVNGGYNITPEEKWKKDVYYIENRSFKLYMKIFMKTLGVITTGEDAR